MSWQEYNWGLVCDDPAICLAVHDLPEPVFLKRASDLRIEWVNRCGQERAMYPPGHFIGKTYYDVLPKEIADLLATTDHELLSGGRARDVRELPVVRGDGSRRNLRLSRSVLRNVDGMPTHVLGVAVDLTDRKKAEEHVKLLLNEANHRAKNLLAVVQVLARHTANEADPNDFVERFAQRLAGLASSHDLLVKSNWRSLDLADLVRSQLAYLGDLVGSRVMLDGPPLRVIPSAAEAIGMALHELATNAVKHGALSDGRGRVRIMWDKSAIGGALHVRMRWSEHNGPPVTLPRRRGFGHTVMVEALEHELDADVRLTCAPSGLVWEITAQAQRVIEQDTPLQRE